MKKELLFVIPGMNGGGAERVLGILASQMAEFGHDATLMLTSQRVEDAVGYKLSARVKKDTLLNHLTSDKRIEKIQYTIIKQYTRVSGSLLEKTGSPIPDHIAWGTFIWQHYKKINALRAYLFKHPLAQVIAFCQPAVNIALLAADGLPNVVILSERLDPGRYKNNRYMPYFVKRWYPTAKRLVFQTESAMSYFDESIQKKSCVIPNPLNPALPQPYHGEREKTIVSFCRITPQKNLKLLVDSFSDVYCKHHDYRLEIYGEGESKSEIQAYIREQQLEDAIRLLPFNSNLHTTILRHAMFVSSSDYEGMSNSMLESMAIGLPTICTDCPAGGARAIIRDHENGILVPVKDRKALASAILELIGNPALSRKLSFNGARIREELDAEEITRKWMKLL